MAFVYNDDSIVAIDERRVRGVVELIRRTPSKIQRAVDVRQVLERYRRLRARAEPRGSQVVNDVVNARAGHQVWDEPSVRVAALRRVSDEGLARIVTVAVSRVHGIDDAGHVLGAADYLCQVEDSDAPVNKQQALGARSV